MRWSSAAGWTLPVLAGYLLFWVLIGIDPGRRRLPPPVLLLIHFAAMAFHAFFGVILLQSTDRPAECLDL